MTSTGLIALLPFIVIVASATIILLLAAFHRSPRLTTGLTMTGLAFALATIPAPWNPASKQIGTLFVVDGFAAFYMGLIFAGSLVVAALSYSYLERRGQDVEEYCILLLCAALGAAAVASSSHFVSFFLGLEILSVSLYALIAYPDLRIHGVEAGIKYLILAAGSAAFLLFGMALIYAQLGTMEFKEIAAGRVMMGRDETVIFLAGLALMVVGIGFKLAVVPFHWWTPDVYEGAPAPVTAFVATVSKGAMFALLLRYFTQVDFQVYRSLFVAFAIIAILSMTAGNLLALLQTNVKRMLAYSSIAHLGYLLVAFLASGPLAATAAAVYLTAYFITTLGAFGVITVLSGRDREADLVEDYRALFWRRPLLAGIFTIMLMSLAGIPLTAGFIGKFYVLAAGEQSALWVRIPIRTGWLLVIALVINSAIGLFYYLRVVAAMAASPERTGTGKNAPESEQISDPRSFSPLPLSGMAVLVFLTLTLLALGVYPSPFINLVQVLFAR